MYSSFQPFFIIAETPLHPGSGSELGVVDLPIQRERHTNFPKIEGSGVKGCIREAFEYLDKEVEIDSQKIKIKEYVPLIFGPEEGEEYAGALAFTDARILLFPVKSLKGVFAWITCPQVVERFKEDMRIAGCLLKDFPDEVRINACPDDSDLIIDSKIVLEEFTFSVETCDNARELAKWLAEKIFPQRDSGNDLYKYWREKLQKDLVILSDDDFTEFVTTSTEIIARTAIDNVTGTVKKGGLWYEEYLPQDTVLYSVAMATPIRVKIENNSEQGNKDAGKVVEFFKKSIPEIIQIGGNQTVGKGIARIKLWEDKNE
ncbi:MAG TPA: type III-B CRISPR module RAMP protein Cmr4 [bacterium]|nr:type III-B CRISPR module RAMP protein Cmr4 [bacterium]